MTKVTLAAVGSLIDTTTAANTINANTAAIVTAFDNTLSRDGTVPNQMQSTLDMNSNRIINLPSAVSLSEPVTMSQLQAATLSPGSPGVTSVGGLVGTVGLGSGLTTSSGVLNTVSFTTGATIVESHVGNAVTFSLKTLAGTDPSASTPIIAIYPNGSTLSVTSPLSITIPASQTMGTTNSIPFRLWFVLINDGGVTRLGVRNCSDINGVYGFPGTGILSSSNVSSANSTGITYTNIAVTSKPFIIIGFCDYNTGLNPVGTWNAPPSSITLYVQGMPNPGDIIQSKQSPIVTSGGITVSTFADTSLSLTLTPSSAINMVWTNWSSYGIQFGPACTGFAALRRGGQIIGPTAKMTSPTAALSVFIGSSWFDAPYSAGSLVYTVAIRTSPGTGETFTFADASGGAVLQLAEIMG